MRVWQSRASAPFLEEKCHKVYSKLVVRVARRGGTCEKLLGGGKRARSRQGAAGAWCSVVAALGSDNLACAQPSRVSESHAELMRRQGPSPFA